ncbi:MAG: SiaB family protein kinase [Bacteroidota bacterium]
MQSVHKRKTLINHSGHLSYDRIGELLNKLKQQARDFDIKLAVYKKLLTASIEILENIYKYHEYFENNFTNDNQFSPCFKIESNAVNFYLEAGNPVLNKDKEELKDKIDKINNLDRQGLKELYKSTITNGRFSDKGGAGLGFIEMAKMSGKKIDYNFSIINDSFSYFRLGIIIPIE